MSEGKTSSAPSMPRRGRMRAAAANAALLLIALCVALALGEVVVRVFAPQQLILIRPDIWEPADSLGWVARPNVRSLINTGERTVHVDTDSLGMRIGVGGRTNPQARTRVLLMGDSFMEALQVEYAQSFAALLEKGLSEKLGYPVSVWDAGVDGWDPPQYLIRTGQLMAAHHFQLEIVALYLGNDVISRRVEYRPPRTPAQRHHFRFPRNLSKHELVDALLYPINDFLEVRSQLFIFMRTRLQNVLMDVGLTPMSVPPGIERRDATSPMWDVTAQVCQDIARLAGAHHTPVLFVLIPAPFAVEPQLAKEVRTAFGIDSAKVDPSQPSRLMLKALRARGLTALAVEPTFDSAAAAGAQLYGHVDRHLSPAGHQLLDRLAMPEAASMLAAAHPSSVR